MGNIRTHQGLQLIWGLLMKTRHIATATADADSVARSAIQGLKAKVEAENMKLCAENAALRERLERLEEAVGADRLMTG